MPASKSRPTKSSAAKRTKSHASEVRPGVFVGGWNDATTFQGARLCVLDEVPPDGMPAEKHLRIYDEKSDSAIRTNLDRVAQFVEEARSRDQPVLLFCGHGVRRSPLAAAWYLHRHDGISLDRAYSEIRAVRPKVEHVKEWVGDWQALTTGDGSPPRT